MPPSLTSQELRVIQAWERSQPCPKVRRLLWEISRLRTVALHADYFEHLASKAIIEANDVTTRVIGDYLRDRLNELPVVTEPRARRNPQWPLGRLQEKKSLGDRAHESERLEHNALTPDEREALIKHLVASVLGVLERWLTFPASLEADQAALDAVQAQFAYLPPALAHGVMPIVINQVAARLRAQLELLRAIADR